MKSLNIVRGETFLQISVAFHDVHKRQTDSFFSLTFIFISRRSWSDSRQKLSAEGIRDGESRRKELFFCTVNNALVKVYCRKC